MLVVQVQVTVSLELFLISYMMTCVITCMLDKLVLGTGHYLSPAGGGGGSEDFGLNTIKFSRSPL